MRIAISMRVVQADGYEEPRDAISHDWIRKLTELDLTPVPVSNAIRDPGAYLDAMAVHGLLLTGGNDLAPERSSSEEAEAATDVASERDEAEFQMLRYAVAHRLPTLGCCRGMQVLNAFFGGRQSQRLEEAVHVGRGHPVEICDVDMARCLGDRLEVNSYHRWGIHEEELSPRLRVFARVPGDGSVEGVYHPALPFLGIMWHPERPGAPNAADEHLIQSLWKGPRGRSAR